MNRDGRRAAARAARRAATPTGHGLPKRCAPGTHAYQRLKATVKGEVTSTRVLCVNCRRTIQQVMAESPEDLAMYRDWLAGEIASARQLHVAACPRRFDRTAGPSDGCPGCVREAQITAEDREVGAP